MHNGKWIEQLGPQAPLAEAARDVLKVRLGTVGHYLPLAIHHAAEDVEHVHQLRVATRRARAALDIFEGSLPVAVAKRARKLLRRLRRAAGAARDCDVFLATLLEIPRGPSRQTPGRDLLVGDALGQRGTAGQELAKLGGDCVKKFEGLQADVLAATSRRRSKRPLLALARSLLVQVAGDLERALAGDLEDYAQLHQVRITGKKLRYAMEVFAGCFGPAFRERLYPVVEEMQDILGLANDSNVALGHLADVVKAIALLPAETARRAAPGVEAVRQFHRERLIQQRQEFTRWHERWRQSGGATAFTNVY